MTATEVKRMEALYPEGKDPRRGFSVGSLLRGGLLDFRRVGGQAVAYAFGWNLLISLVGGPVLSWLFREFLHSDGMVAVDLATTTISGRTILSSLFLVAAAIVAFSMLFMQVTSVFYILEGGWEGNQRTFKEVAKRMGAVLRKGTKLSSLPVFLYAFVMLPLSGMGFFSVATQGIAVPNFITGELEKDPIFAVLYHLAMLVLFYVNVRFALALPLFTLTPATGGQAMKESWHLTRGWAFVNIFLSAAAIVIPGLFVAYLVQLVFVIPTWITDHVAIAASPYVAAFSVAAAEVMALIWLSSLWAILFSVLLQAALPKYVELAKRSAEPTVGPTEVKRKRSWWKWLSSVGGVLALVLGFAYIPAIQGLVLEPDTMVISHRGYVAGGVENTISALEAASDAGADRVEMDIMQTKDGKFVVIHDTSLNRLAGVKKKVKDMTQEELMEVTVHDTLGHTDTIPSLEEYVTRAKELDMPLLMEVKMGGLDSEDHVDLLVEELTRLDALDGNWFHSLDPASVTRLKELLPDTQVGYIMPFSGDGVPDTKGDFLVLEEYTASVAMQQHAGEAGLGYIVWTVDEDDAQRLRFRQGVGAIITDEPVMALESRHAMNEQTGYAAALLDLLENMLPG